MIRNRWMFAYAISFLIMTSALLFLSRDFASVIISMTNVVLGLAPLVGMLFGVMYYYNAREFLELLLAQPISRFSLISGIYFGQLAALTLSIIIGIGLPMIFFGILTTPFLAAFLILLSMSIILSAIFSLMAFIIALKNENRVKGFGIAIFVWLFFAIIYDGLFLMVLILLKDYPLESLSITLTMLNPIDLARILIILKLDISAMMGYTGAVLHKYLGTQVGTIAIALSLIFWLGLLTLRAFFVVNKKDF